MAQRLVPQKIEVVHNPASDPIYGRDYEIRVSVTPAMVQTITLTFEELAGLYDDLGELVS